jgi:lipoprotein-anchoring transpeptidase ErfK/SrfK
MQNVNAGMRVVQEKSDPRRSKMAAWKLTLIAGAGASFILVSLPIIVLLGVFFYHLATGLIMPGVSVGGIPLQGLTLQQASAVINQVWNVEYRIGVVNSSDSKVGWHVAPSEFGLGVDAQVSAELAYARGRGEGVILGVLDMIDTWLNGWAIQPWVSYDPMAARNAVETWATRMYVAPIDADLSVHEGEIIPVTAQQGRLLDVEATLGLLSSDPTALLMKYRFMLLVMDPVDPETEDVSGAVAEAERLIGSMPSIRAYDPVTGELFDWNPSRAEISSWLQIERSVGDVRVSLDADRVAAYVANLNESLGEERGLDLAEGQAAVNLELQGGDTETLIIRYQPTSYVVQPSDTLISISLQVGIPYWKIVEYNPRVATYGLSVGNPIVIPPKDAMLELPVVVNKRIVISISQQHMWVYQDGSMIRDHVVSTGIPSSPTMAGIFQIKSHVLNAYASRWDLYMPHFMGIYDATPYLENGIHGLPLLSSGVRLWGSVLGRPASYGCIILTLQAAEELYNWADDGVVVEIQR